MFLFIFTGKSNLQREGETKLSCLLIHSPSGCSDGSKAYPNSGASTGFPVQVQGPKALAHPPEIPQSPQAEYLEESGENRIQAGSHTGYGACKEGLYCDSLPMKIVKISKTGDNFYFLLCVCLITTSFYSQTLLVCILFLYKIIGVSELSDITYIK